jgi:hypothetical protein
MTNRCLRLAGFMAMTSAILSIPFLVLSYRMMESNDRSFILCESIMQLAGLFLFIFLIAMFRRLLNIRHKLHAADNYIDFMIITNLIFTVAAISGPFLPDWENALLQFSRILIIAFGIAQILFGIKLFQVTDGMKGMLRPFSLITIATGAMVATLVLLPIGVITGAISDVMLGTIFFQAVSSPESTEGG